MSKVYEIPEELVIGLLKYMSNKPHHEVRQGVLALENLKEIKTEKEE